MGQDFAEAKANITFTDGEIIDNEENDTEEQESNLFTLICKILESLCVLLSCVVDLLLSANII